MYALFCYHHQTVPNIFSWTFPCFHCFHKFLNVSFLLWTFACFHFISIVVKEYISFLHVQQHSCNVAKLFFWCVLVTSLLLHNDLFPMWQFVFHGVSNNLCVLPYLVLVVIVFFAYIFHTSLSFRTIFLKKFFMLIQIC